MLRAKSGAQHDKKQTEMTGSKQFVVESGSAVIVKTS